MNKILAFLILVLVMPINAYAGGGHDHGSKHDHEEGKEEGHGEEEESEGISTEGKDLARFGLELKKAASATIFEGVSVSGRIVPLDDKLAHVSPRFPGVIREVKAKVGDLVKADTLLAVVQNNQNLQTYPVYSAISGVVIKRHATLGETVGDDSVLFIVADLSEVWAELAVYKQDVDSIKLGQKAQVTIASHLKPQEGEVIFFSPITEEKTQSRLARVLIKNPDPHFSPGAFVSGTIVTKEKQVAVAVDQSAIQRVEGAENIFVKEGEKFESRSVVTGSSDEGKIEIISGLKSGEEYASGNTFILKAELGKSEAEHEH